MTRFVSPERGSFPDTAILVLRLGIAAMMLGNGIPKMQQLFSGGPIAFPPVMGMSPTLSLALAVFSEVVCSILLALGLLSRLAVIPPIITMLVAVFLIHGADPFVKKEPALLYLIPYITVLLAGPGRYSIDSLIARRGRAIAKRSHGSKAALIPQ